MVMQECHGDFSKMVERFIVGPLQNTGLLSQMCMHMVFAAELVYI